MGLTSAPLPSSNNLRLGMSLHHPIQLGAVSAEYVPHGTMGLAFTQAPATSDTYALYASSTPTGLEIAGIHRDRDWEHHHRDDWHPNLPSRIRPGAQPNSHQDTLP